MNDRQKAARSLPYDSTLFPVDIPTEVEDELLASVQISGLLRIKFAQHEIVRLGQLRGMTPEDFLAWKGFGSTCMGALCALLASARLGKTPNPLTNPIGFDPDLFPVEIPAEIEYEVLANLEIPGSLKNWFDLHSIIRLGQLRGLTPGEFLGRRGFGPTRMQALCDLLASAKAGNVTKSLSGRYEALSRESPLPDFLSFPFDKLNISPLLRTKFRHECDIHTVADFLDAVKAAQSSRPGWRAGALKRVWPEIASLESLGAERYLSKVSLESPTFIEIVDLIRQKLGSRGLVIFDHRFFPRDGQVESLEMIGFRLGRTRERARQLEKAFIKGFQSGKLRDFGRLIRRKTLELFKDGVQEMRFEELLRDRLFAGVPATNHKGFAAFVFLDRVCYATFIVKDDKLVLNKRGMQR